MCISLTYVTTYQYQLLENYLTIRKLFFLYFYMLNSLRFFFLQILKRNHFHSWIYISVSNQTASKTIKFCKNAPDE